jgi:hypothetical protein
MCGREVNTKEAGSWRTRLATDVVRSGFQIELFQAIFGEYIQTFHCINTTRTWVCAQFFEIKWLQQTQPSGGVGEAIRFVRISI